MISCGSYSSMPEAFAPLQRKNDDRTPRMNPAIPPTLVNEWPRVILSNKAPRIALTRPTISSTKKESKNTFCFLFKSLLAYVFRCRTSV